MTSTDIYECKHMDTSCPINDKKEPYSISYINDKFAELDNKFTQMRLSNNSIEFNDETKEADNIIIPNNNICDYNSQKINKTIANMQLYFNDNITSFDDNNITLNDNITLFDDNIAIFDDDFTTFDDNDEKGVFDIINIIDNNVICKTDTEIERTISDIYTNVLKYYNIFLTHKKQLDVNKITNDNFIYELEIIFNYCNAYIIKLNNICNFIVKVDVDKTNKCLTEIYKNILIELETVNDFFMFIIDIEPNTAINNINNIDKYLNIIMKNIFEIHINVYIKNMIIQSLPPQPQNEDSLSCSSGLICNFFNKIKELFI